MTIADYAGELPGALHPTDPLDLNDMPWTLVCARVLSGEMSAETVVNHLTGPGARSDDLVQKSLAILPLVAGTREQHRLCNRVLGRLATMTAYASDRAEDILGNVWPWLPDDTAKQRALDQVERYLRRRRKDPSGGQEPLLLMRFARLDPAWFPRLLSRAIEFPYPTDILWVLQHADDALRDYVLPQLSGKLWLPDHYQQRFLGILDSRPPEIAFRILDENLALLRRWGKRTPGLPINKGRLSEWVLARDPEIVLSACGARELLWATIPLPDRLYQALVPHLVKLSPVELANQIGDNQAFREALGDDDFLRLTHRVGQLLPDALKKTPRYEAGSIIEMSGPLHDLFHCWLTCQPAIRDLPQTARFIDSQLVTLILAIDNAFTRTQFEDFSEWVNKRLSLPDGGHPGHALLAAGGDLGEGQARYTLLKALNLEAAESAQATCLALMENHQPRPNPQIIFCETPA